MNEINQIETMTIYSIGDFTLRKSDAKYGRVEKVLEAPTSSEGVSSGRYLVSFLCDAVPDRDVELYGAELLPVTKEATKAFLASRFDEDAKREDEWARKRDEVQERNRLIEAQKLGKPDYFNAKIDEYKAEQFRGDFAAILNDGINNLECTQTNSRIIAEKLLCDVNNIVRASGEDHKGFPEFPFFTGSLAELTDVLCPDLPWAFKFMSAVSHWGLIRSGLDTLEREPHLQPRFYTALIAEPGRGKSASINEVRNIFAGVSTRYARCSSVDSGPAMVDLFAEQNEKMKSALFDDRAARLLIDADELSDVFEKAKVSKQSRNSIFAELLKLFESTRTGNNARSAGKKTELDNCHLGLLAGATTEGYSNLWSGTGGGANGLQSRFCLIASNARKLPSEQRPSDAAALGAIVGRLRQQAARPAQRIQIAPEASERFRVWWNSSPRDKASETRIADLGKRLLICLATTNDTCTVDAKLMEQAIAFANYEIAMREMLNPADSHSWVQAFENLIVQVCERHPEPMTINDLRRLVHPERKPGGYGPFMQAAQNLMNAGRLQDAGRTERGGKRLKLAA